MMVKAAGVSSNSTCEIRAFYAARSNSRVAVRTRLRDSEHEYSTEVPTQQVRVGEISSYLIEWMC